MEKYRISYSAVAGGIVYDTGSDIRSGTDGRSFGVGDLLSYNAAESFAYAFYHSGFSAHKFF